MSQPNAPDPADAPNPAKIPNPERRSDAALLCLCIGLGLLGLAWFLGVGGVLATAFSGGSPAGIAGGVGAFIGLILAAVCGALLALVGAVWLFVRVIADQREDHSKERYSREVER
ncbi:MAG: hypothetical protein JNJ73_00895 [Hyphomonadaceae bacterium]|nr:hypothetical protein [Hyphomonadaceae bacterium]